MPLACALRQMRVWPATAARLTGHTRRRANGKKRHRFCSRWPATAAAGDVGHRGRSDKGGLCGERQLPGDDKHRIASVAGHTASQPWRRPTSSGNLRLRGARPMRYIMRHINITPDGLPSASCSGAGHGRRFLILRERSIPNRPS